ncbi:MAG: long-chain fatty acid--CoA ligase [Proteobacteria bacterium]|nr:long-chain fatty acid--CoA ligase [Pseudomonadota bacterium]MBU1742214.1 long-chain fatty acid--CoA ligase [Pseudomonadota bacterium]
MAARTLVDVFTDNAERFTSQTIIKYKPKKGGDYVDLSWAELEEMSFALAAGLVDSGLGPGDRAAILSFNRLEWIAAEMGIMLAGGVSVAIYHTNTPEQCAHVLRDSGSRFVFVEDEEQLAKINGLDLPALEKIVLIQGTLPAGDDRVISYQDLLSLGLERGPDLADELARRRDDIKPDDMATLVYTSGTTGPPKGCMESHRNLIAMLDAVDHAYGGSLGDELSLLILPVSHLYPRASGYYYNLYKNIPLAIAESLDTLGQDMARVRPTYFASVPRIFEKVYDRIMAEANKGSGLKRAIFTRAVATGRQRSRRLNDHQPLSPWLIFKFRLADRLVFSKIRNLLGGRLWFAVSAGAPLAAEVGEFMHSIGVQVLEYYGLTEAIGGTVTTFDQCRYGTVGKPMKGVEVKLADDGEIMLKGNNFLGYYNQPDLTAEVLRDGWVYTGDVGRFDEDGFLIITDRKKDLIITSGGKNISPQNIENALARIPLVAVPFVYGDNRKYLTALITLDRAETEKWATDQGLAYDSYEALTQGPEIRDHVQAGLDRVNAALPRYETIKQFVIIEREFSQDEGEITPTLKVKRKPILDKFGPRLDALYR